MNHLANVVKCNLKGGWPLELFWWLGTETELVPAQDVLKSYMQSE